MRDVSSYLLALIGTHLSFTPHHFRISYSTEIHEWCCCCAIDCGTSDVQMSLFPWKYGKWLSKFLYFRPIWNFMNVCDRPTTAVLKPQSVSSPHTFFVIQNARSRPKSSNSSFILFNIALCCPISKMSYYPAVIRQYLPSFPKMK